MIHNGPIPYLAHQAIDYLVGVLLIAAPFLIGFSNVAAATAVAIVLGILVLLAAASTDGPLSLVDAIPVPVHVVLDVGVAVLAIASPFLFGFSDQSTPLPFFLIFGVLELLVVIATRFPRETRRRQAA